MNKYITVTVSGLKLTGTEYTIHLARSEVLEGGHILYKESSIRASTLLVKPKSAPKLGAGCFFEWALSLMEKSQTVKVYWQHMPAANYRLQVYEEGNSSPVFTEVGPTDRGW